MTRISFVIFLSSLGKKINHFLSTSALLSSLFLVAITLCFAWVSKKALYTCFSWYKKETIKQQQQQQNVYLHSCEELTFIFLSEFWIRMLPCLLSIAMVMSVQVMKGCTCIIYIKVAGILNLFCVI